MECKCTQDSWIGEPGPICDRYEPTADHYCVSCHHDALCHKMDGLIGAEERLPERHPL
jgi:hypothetical protein